MLFESLMVISSPPLFLLNEMVGERMDKFQFPSFINEIKGTPKLLSFLESLSVMCKVCWFVSSCVTLGSFLFLFAPLFENLLSFVFDCLS